MHRLECPETARYPGVGSKLCLQPDVSISEFEGKDDDSNLP